MCCYLKMCTAGSEQNYTVLPSNTHTEYRLDLSDLHLVTVQLQTCLILIVFTSIIYLTIHTIYRQFKYTVDY